MELKIKELIEAGEGYHLEFKESLDKSFLEEVCAFANSGGGKILIGVRDDGTIKGCATDNRSRSVIQDALRGLQPNLDINLIVREPVIIVDVPEGKDKPYACSKGFYIRNGANSQKLTRNEIIAFFQKEGLIRFDELRNEHADFEKDFDEKAFHEFLKSAGISRSISKLSLLKNLNCLTAEGRLTNAGVLFFAKDIDFLINHAVVVCVLFKGTQKIHILDKKDFKGNIVDNINNAILFVQRHTNLEYVIKKLKRDEIPDIPEVALRESIINAVCHRDYFDKRANVLVEVFDDRVVVSNPGGLPSGLDPADFGKKSIARNPLIASLLQRIHFIEKVGTGISRIRDAVRENGKSTVEFSFNEFFTVTYHRSRKEPDDGLTDSEKTAQKNEGLSEGLSDTGKPSEKPSEKTSEKTSEKILRLIQANPEITIQELSAILNKTTRAIEMQLNKLKEKGKIIRNGPDKGGHWEVVKKDGQ
jgi:ATP-dependent DNA helicase RecG